MPELSENDTIIAKQRARQLKVPFVDPLRAAIEPSALSLLEPEMALRRQALPIRVVDNFLLVAMMKPEEPVAIKSLELLTGFKVRPAVAPKKALFIGLKKYYGNGYAGEPGVKNRRPRTPRKKTTGTTGEDRSGPCTISVISNKGGVGKTHLSINTAYSLAKKGARVLLQEATWWISWKIEKRWTSFFSAQSTALILSPARTVNLSWRTCTMLRK